MMHTQGHPEFVYSMATLRKHIGLDSQRPKPTPASTLVISRTLMPANGSLLGSDADVASHLGCDSARPVVGRKDDEVRLKRRR